MPTQHVLGITAKRFNRRIFGEQTSYLRGIIRLAAQRGMKGYVFTLSDVDEVKQQVRAWVWSRSGWVRRSQPFPTVIYDRMWGLQDEARQTFEQDLKSLSLNHNIPFFNPFFGCKYTVHQTLSSHPELRQHLPDTSLLTPEALRRLAYKHSTLYIKPVRGRQGKGIVRLDARQDRYKITRQGSPKGFYTAGIDEAYTRCFASAQREDYIVQQGLNLLRVHGGTVDVRVIVQRDAKGVWQVSAVGCRIGPRGGFVSNLHAGGRAAGISVLAPYLPRSSGVKQLRRDIHSLALSTAQRMSETHLDLGEIGLDVGVDVDGNLWILELNRQPGRALFSRAGLRKSWSRSRVRVVQFARYLSSTAAKF